MENKKIIIFIIDEKEKKYSLEVEKIISYENLKKSIILKFHKKDNFYIVFKKKTLNKEDIITFNEGDMIYLIEYKDYKIEKEIKKPKEDKEYGRVKEYLGKKREYKRAKKILKPKEKPAKKIVKKSTKKRTIPRKKLINIHFFENEDYNSENSGSDIALDLIQLNGILNLCLIKYISLNIEDSEIKKIKSKEIANIITSLKNNIEFKDELLEDIKSVLKEKSGNNILVYSEYINMIMTKDKTESLLNLLEKKKQEKIKLYWNKLSKYESINQSFEKDFKLAIKKSYFDYSVISISIKEQNNLSNYIQNKNNCDNCETKFLYHGTQIDPISKIITTGFLYSRKPFYGLGIYFSDMIDYIEFYCGGETYEDRRKNFGKNLSVGESFSFVASEVYYDKNKIKNIYNYDYYIDELDRFPTYEEIKELYSDKMVEKNGIHFAEVEPEQGQVKDKYEILSEKKRGKFLGTEFVITEMNQIFPLFGITLKRNEYFIIWRDPNFEDKNNYSIYLQECKNFLNEKANMNVYFESCTENALELIKRKKYNKIIIISSIGLDLSGKKFIEVARKILGFNAMVLFYSANKNHLEWIQHFPNALYTNNDDFYQKYVTNYNENGLKILKKEIQKEYNIKLPKFTKDFIKFPKFVDKKKYSDMIFDEINDNFRKVLINNIKANKMLCIENEQIYFKSFDKNKDFSFVWFITIIDNEITFYSNGVYLSVDKFNEKVVGEKYMKRWSFEKVNNRYKFYFENTKKCLTLDKNKNKSMAEVKVYKAEDYQTFELIDFY